MRLFPDSALLQVEPSIFLEENQLLPPGLASCGQACCLLFYLRQGILCPSFCLLSAPITQQFLIKVLLIFCVLPSLCAGGRGRGLGSWARPGGEPLHIRACCRALPLASSVGDSGTASATIRASRATECPPALGSLRALSDQIGTSSRSPKSPLLVL